MASEEFYLDVFSGASLKLFPENRLSHFKVQLPRPLVFEKEYEMCLCEYMIPGNFTSITEGRILVETMPETDEEKLAATKNVQYSTKYFSTEMKTYTPNRTEEIPDTVKKYFLSADTLKKAKFHTWVFDFPRNKVFFDEMSIIAYFNSLLQDEVNGHVFSGVLQKRKKTKERNVDFINAITVKKIGNGISIIIRDEYLHLFIQGSVARLLGIQLDDSQWLLLSEQGRYDFPDATPNPDAGRPRFLNIYTNCLDPLITGDTTAPLLRTVPIYKTANPSDTISREVLSRNYITVNVKSLQILEFEIRDASGKYANFDLGHIYFRLHFRPKKQRD